MTKRIKTFSLIIICGIYKRGKKWTRGDLDPFLIPKLQRAVVDTLTLVSSTGHCRSRLQLLVAMPRFKTCFSPVFFLLIMVACGDDVVA